MENTTQPTATETHNNLVSTRDKLIVELFYAHRQRKTLDDDIAAKEASLNNINHMLDGATLGAAAIREIDAAAAVPAAPSVEGDAQ